MRAVGGIPESAAAAEAIIPRRVGSGIPRRTDIEADDFPTSSAGIDRRVGHELVDAEATGSGNRVLFVCVVQPTQRRGLGWELVTAQNAKLGKAAWWIIVVNWSASFMPNASRGTSVIGLMS